MNRTFDVATSLGMTIGRLGAGLRVETLGERPEKPLELYDFEGCPYCRKVREALTALDLEALVHPCPKGGKRFRESVIAAGGKAQFEIGTAADKWADKIRNPRTLIDKLGVKPGMRVAVIDVDDAEFRAQLAARTNDITEGRPKAGTDVIVFGAESIAALARLERLRAALKPNGAIWVVHRKGRDASLRDVDVFAAAKRAGLVDNKTARFSESHTALRLVVPRDRR